MVSKSFFSATSMTPAFAMCARIDAHAQDRRYATDADAALGH
jgi:hypothetical protein